MSLWLWLVIAVILLDCVFVWSLARASQRSVGPAEGRGRRNGFDGEQLAKSTLWQ